MTASFKEVTDSGQVGMWLIFEFGDFGIAELYFPKLQWLLIWVRIVLAGVDSLHTQEKEPVLLALISFLDQL